MRCSSLSPFVAWLAPFVAAEQKPLNFRRSSPFTPSFDKHVASNLERWHTPGLAVAVIDGEKTHSKVCFSIA